MSYKHFNDYDWNPERLKKLIGISGCSDVNVSRATGMSYATIRKYLSGEVKPTAPALIRLANLFAVPVDYLVGRCSEEEKDKLFCDYPAIYESLRRKEFETVMLRQNTSSINIPQGYEAPYPYNLMDDIFTEPTDWILSEDNIKGLDDAIASLDEREQKIINLRYREGFTLEETGKVFHLTRDRIRQLQARAVRKLRNPARSKQILYGEEGSKRLKELQEKERALKLKEIELNSREAAIESREKVLNKRLEMLNQDMEEKAAEKLEADLDISVKAAMIPNDEPKIGVMIGLSSRTNRQFSEALDELNLSVRSYNCLRRADICSIAETIEHIQDGSILKVRNLGRKSLDEIIDKIAYTTGIRCIVGNPEEVA